MSWPKWETGLRRGSRSALVTRACHLNSTGVENQSFSPIHSALFQLPKSFVPVVAHVSPGNLKSHCHIIIIPAEASSLSVHPETKKPSACGWCESKALLRRKCSIEVLQHKRLKYWHVKLSSLFHKRQDVFEGLSVLVDSSNMFNC